MNRTIRIEGFQILAQALLSQGNATSPCSVFVAYIEEKDEYVMASFNHDNGFYFNGVYWQADPEALRGAMEGFAAQVERDARKLEHGVPLTEGQIGEPPREKWDLNPNG